MFENFVETLTNTGKNGGEFVKLNYKVLSAQKSLDDLYNQIGRLFVEENGATCTEGEIGELTQQAAAKAVEIESLKAQLRMIRGVVVCENCGAEVDAENDFCGKCGTKLVKPEPPVEEPAEEVTDDEATVEVEVVVDEDGDLNEEKPE